ncbi:hypothetical protein F66182_9629 [Fusarium sp. NRRL 66182]|nr:hypothetical protein F66182_9629 [Fusarium sp. NRRL 66182]
MKGCSYCQRTFHKTEHLLRHERSHTGEKPYRCDTCGRGYARRSAPQSHDLSLLLRLAEKARYSDVLLRHVRYFHGPDMASKTDRSSSDSSVNRKNHRKGSIQSNPASQHAELRPEPGPGSHVEQRQSQRQDSARQQEPQPRHEQNHSPLAQRLAAPDLDALAAVSMLQALHDRPAESANTSHLAVDDPFGQHLGHDDSDQRHGDNQVSPLTLTHDMIETTMSTATPNLLTASAEFLGPETSLGCSAGSMQSQSALNSSTWPHIPVTSACWAANDLVPGPVNNDTYFNDAQYYPGALELLQPNLSALDFMDFSLGQVSPGAHRGSQASSNDPVSSIPLERFARVAKLWPGDKAHSASQLASKIWVDIVAYRRDNICTDASTSEPSPNPAIGNENESKRDIDEEKRQDLILKNAILS